ncbi:MAG: hypothetical protein HRS57_00240 [Mycoplasmataceae bacterium]|nr:hypothetical protein [Mycoplasmataceae bacterium]
MFKKYKAFMISLASLTLLIVSIFLIGLGSDIRPDADFVITYREVSSLDYVTQQGQVNQLITPTIESYLVPNSPTADVKEGGKDPMNQTGSSNALESFYEVDSDGNETTTKILDNAYLKDENGINTSNYDLEYLLEQAEWGNKHVIDALSNWTQFDWLISSIDEVASDTKDVITGYNQTATFFQHDLASYDSFSLSSNPAADDDSITASGSDIYDISGYSMGMAESIHTNDTKTKWTIELRDDYKWITSGDDHGEVVNARDFAFAIEQQVRVSNGASSSYQIIDYSNINGVNSCISAQTNASNPDNWSEIPECKNIVVSQEEYNNLSSDVTDIENKSQVGVIYSGTADEPGFTIEYILSATTTYFPTLLMNSSFYPVDYSWWVETFGDPLNGQDKLSSTGKDSSSQYGKSASYYRSNGAYYIDSFDATYQTVFLANPYYANSNNVLSGGVDLQQADKWIYRVSTEPATQVTLFKNGYSSYSLLDDSVASAVTSDPGSSQYIQATLSNPNSRYYTYNVSSDSKTGNSEYILDDDFRRAMTYALDRTSYLNLNGQDSAYPGQTFTPMRLGTATLDGKTTDFVDFAEKMKYQAYPGDTRNDNTLTTLDSSERNKTLSMSVDDLNDPNSSISRDDDITNVEAARYYYEEFSAKFPSAPKLDSSNNDIVLKQISTDANSDVTYKAWNESMDSAGIPIVIYPVSAPGTQFWTEYYSGENWDVISLQWNPDYTDPMAFLNLFLTPDFGRKTNNSGGWTYLYGDAPGEYSITSGTQSESGLISLLNDSQRMDMYFSQTSVSELYTGELTVFSADGKATGATQKLDKSTNVENWELVLNNLVNILSYNPNSSSPSGDIDGIPSDYYKTIYYEDFWQISDEERFLYYTVMEMLIRDGAPVAVLSNETVSTTASRLIFMTTPPVGYSNYTYAYDCRNAAAGMPDCDDLIGTREKMQKVASLN